MGGTDGEDSSELRQGRQSKPHSPCRAGPFPSKKKIELVIVIMFTIELAVNAFGNWFWPFIESPWNMFDIFVVFICWSAVALR